MGITRQLLYFGCFQVALLICEAKLTPGQPKGPLPWGDSESILAVLVRTVTLTDGFLDTPRTNGPNQITHFISFVGHMKKLAEERSVDLLLVDSGDLHDGSGLTDGYPSGGINGEEAIKSFLKVPYDVMAIGKYNNFAPKLDGRYLSSNSYLLAKHENGTDFEDVIGSRYRRFKTLRGRQVTSLGVIFDFKEHDKSTTVHGPTQMIEETWFKELLLQPTDIFVLAGTVRHMSVAHGEWGVVSKKIREQHPNTPIAILGGHTHSRDCRQFDSNTMALESGRFMETVGWMSEFIPLQPMLMSQANNASVIGKEVDGFNQELTTRWNLSQIHGCSSQKRLEWPHAQNIYAFYIFQVLPEVLIKTSGREDKPHVIIINNGMLRFDIYRGTFTWNDQLTALPFKDPYMYIEVPWSIALKVKEKLNEYPKDHINTARFLKEKFGSSAYANVPDYSSQTPLSMSPDPSPGYVTKDECGGNGDDTDHAPIPVIPNPDYMSNDPVYPIPPEVVVDLIIPKFLKPRLLKAINELGFNATEDKMHQYGNVTSKESEFRRWSGIGLALTLLHQCSLGTLSISLQPMVNAPTTSLSRWPLAIVVFGQAASSRSNVIGKSHITTGRDRKLQNTTMSIPSTVKAQKAALRQTVLHARSLLSPLEIRTGLFGKFYELVGPVPTKFILYLNSHWGDFLGKTLYVPRMNGRVIDMLRVYDLRDLDALPSGKWGIQEPEPVKDAMQAGDLDLIVMPGVAFDDKLARLGYGRGYYDRFVNTYAEKFGAARTPKLCTRTPSLSKPRLFPITAYSWSGVRCANSWHWGDPSRVSR
ncbi:vacuolar protein [Rhizoctonia solani AG-1 IA]|uniref:Vacuolar protein n=1 Tax=Thanatephorus cucumeris (strain AG1-IA) TaxID=983506 RepID=L8WTD3_THACA|nr:vacuolar protein [Rhizoctonia solani AG-1 IA]